MGKIRQGWNSICYFTGAISVFVSRCFEWLEQDQDLSTSESNTLTHVAFFPSLATANQIRSNHALTVLMKRISQVVKLLLKDVFLIIFTKIIQKIIQGVFRGFKVVPLQLKHTTFSRHVPVHCHLACQLILSLFISAL